MIHLYILLCCIFTAAQVSGQSSIYALKGQSVTLRPEVSGQPEQLLWKHKGNKVVEFDGSEQQVYSPFDNRITLDWHSAELDVKDLRYEDSGEYELEVYMNKMLHRSQYNVKVIDRVPKPTISCETHNGSSSNTDGAQATLMCSVESKEPQSLMKFEWISRGNVQPGPELTIHLKDKHDDEEYSCRVSNPLTLETSTFIAKDCYPDETSSVGVAVGIGLTILLTVIVIASICFCKQRHKACFAQRMQSDLEGHESPARAKGLVQIRIEQFETNSGGQNLPPASPPGSGKKTSQNDEDKPLLQEPCFSQQLDQSNTDLNPDDPDGNYCNDTNTHSEHGMQTQAETPRKGKAEDKDEETESPPAAQPSLPLSQKSSGLETNETTGEHMEGADPDQVTGESAEENVQKSESSDLERRNGPTNFTSPKEEGPETTLHEQESNLPQEETSSQEDKCQEKSESGCVKKLRSHFEQNSGDQNLPPASPPGSGKKTSQNDEDKPLLQKPCFSQQHDQSNTDLNPDDPDGNYYNASDKHPVHAMETQDETPRKGKAEDKDEETESPPAAQPSLPLSQKSSGLETNETTGEHMEGADPDQVTGESAEENVQKSESSDLERRNGPTNFTSPKEEGPETTLHEQESNLPQEETSSEEDKCQEKSESGNEQEDLPLDNSQQPQSPTTPDNTNDTVQAPLNAAQVDTDNDKEGKTRHDSCESEGQPDSSLAEADEDEDKGENIENEDQCDPGIKKPE
ncbi:serine-aspartate repeat-containing protein F isoform X2 [Mastacembelus armatus]|uniref:serine-aspartate repeat-containing protein F isoform X2 n=1 Tax=Mastacembelus armatus TaxID=205130 RepID=UPI000E461BCB|nr:lymphocyte function-associated antigen 3 isoform X2 [Mastacembelus armatus]